MQINTITSNKNIDNFMKNTILNIRNNRIKNELNCYYQFSLGIQNRHYNSLIKNNNILSYVNLINVDNINDKIIATFYLKLEENKYTFVVFEFDENTLYPFRPPNIKIQNQNYKELLNINFEYLKKINIKTECLCCSSLICKGNWSAHNNIAIVLDEIKTNLNLKLRVHNHKMCNYVIDKLFGYYLPIDTFL